MGTIPKVRKTVREKKNVRKCHIKTVTNPECQGNKPPIVNTHALYTYFNVICAMQIMSGTLPDTYINT